MKPLSYRGRVVLAISMMVAILLLGLSTVVVSNLVQTPPPAPPKAPPGAFTWTASHALVPVTLDSDLSVIESSGLTGSECQSLMSDTVATRSIPPIPNSSLEVLWKRVLVNTKKIDLLCTISNPSGSQLQSATNIASSAVTDLTTIIDRLNLLKN